MSNKKPKYKGTLALLIVLSGFEALILAMKDFALTVFCFAYLDLLFSVNAQFNLID